jgi:hypothetical protein
MSNRSSNKAVDKNQLHNAHSTPDERWVEKTSFKVDILGDSPHPRNISLMPQDPYLHKDKAAGHSGSQISCYTAYVDQICRNSPAAVLSSANRFPKPHLQGEIFLFQL